LWPDITDKARSKGVEHGNLRHEDKEYGEAEGGMVEYFGGNRKKNKKRTKKRRKETANWGEA